MAVFGTNRIPPVFLMPVMVETLASMKFPSKILLFGEHSIIKGSKALAIPFYNFSGHWQKGEQPDETLIAFAAYLKQLPHLDMAAFLEDLHSGWYFESNIPIGYGLGSSGALCAAVWQDYGIFSEKWAPAQLKIQLGKMESFFHGSSSGIDPLVSFLQQPVVIESNGAISTFSEMTDLETHCFFLLDTGLPRKTGPLVNLFLEKCLSAEYLEAITQKLIPLNAAAIKAWLENKGRDLFGIMHEISLFQFYYFREMIPEAFLSIWEAGLADNSTYKLKLCGAGGGGFILGIKSKDKPYPANFEGYSVSNL